MRNMLKVLMQATEEYIPLKREILGIEPSIFLDVANKCGFQAIHIGDKDGEKVMLKRLGIPTVKLYDYEESNEFHWLDLSDFHVGHKDFCEDVLIDVLAKYYERVKNKRHKYVFIAGDAFNALDDSSLSYELVNKSPNYRKQVLRMYYQQQNILVSILSRFPLDYFAVNGNHEYMYVQLGLPSPLKAIEYKMFTAGINYRYYDTYVMDFIIAGFAKRVMHLEGYGHLQEGVNPVYDRVQKFAQNKQLVSYYKRVKYPVRFILSGHRHIHQVTYDSALKIYIVEAGSFIKREMVYRPSVFISGRADKKKLITLT